MSYFWPTFTSFYSVVCAFFLVKYLCYVRSQNCFVGICCLKYFTVKFNFENKHSSSFKFYLMLWSQVNGIIQYINLGYSCREQRERVVLGLRGQSLRRSLGSTKRHLRVRQEETRSRYVTVRCDLFRFGIYFNPYIESYKIYLEYWKVSNKRWHSKDKMLVWSVIN